MVRYSPALSRSIFRILGAYEDADADTFAEPIQDGDSLVLCSDGLTDFVEDEEIKIMVEQHQPRAYVDHLIRLANKRGGRDNIAVVVVKLSR
jgi:serine/threonine protein phosphatase PrpC